MTFDMMIFEVWDVRQDGGQARLGGGLVLPFCLRFVYFVAAASARQAAGLR